MRSDLKPRSRVANVVLRIAQQLISKLAKLNVVSGNSDHPALFPKLSPSIPNKLATTIVYFRVSPYIERRTFNAIVLTMTSASPLPTLRLKPGQNTAF